MYYRPGYQLTPVVKNLIIINVIVWILQIYFTKLNFPLENYGALWSLQSGNFKVWQLVTHMFMHSAINPSNGSIEFMHLLFNMVGLFFFGHRLEQHWGSKRFLEFYMVCGLVAGLTELALSQFSLAVGASGAVMGLMAGFAYLFPNTEVLVGWFGIPVKMKYIAGATILMSLFGGFDAYNEDHIAHWAHLGGAIAGLVMVYISNKRNRKNFY